MTYRTSTTRRFRTAIPAAVLVLALAAPLTLPAAEHTLDGDDLDNLLLALGRQYYGLAVCDRAVHDLGARQALDQQRHRQRRQVAATAALFRSYNLEVPANPYDGRVGPFADLESACEAGLRSALGDAELFERLAASTGRPDLAGLYAAAATNARERAIPAFRDCAMEQLAGR
jgi:hypothetical protein